jgi:hypothetical protein
VQFGFVVVECGDDVVAACVIVKYVEFSARNLGDAVTQLFYRVIARELEGEVRYVGVGGGIFGGVADGSEDLETWMCKFTTIECRFELLGLPLSANSSARKWPMPPGVHLHVLAQAPSLSQ